MFRVVSHETRIARDILSSQQVHGGRIAGQLDSVFVSFLPEGRTITGTGDVQEAVANWIRTGTTEVEAAEKVHHDELGKLSKLRAQRDAAQGELYRETLGVRTMFEGTAGPGKSSQVVGLDPGLSRVDSQELRRYARFALTKLESPGFVPPPVVAGATINPLEAAGALRPKLERYEALLDQVDLQKRVVEQAQNVRAEALERLHFVNVYGSRMFEAFYNLAGARFHAERIRSSSSRSGVRSSSPAPPAPPPAEEPPTPEEPAPPPAEEASAPTADGESPDPASSEARRSTSP